MTSNFAKQTLTAFPMETETTFLGLICLTPEQEIEAFNKSLAPSSPKPPLMLARLRCAAKEYLSMIAEKEEVFPSNTHTLHIPRVSSSSEFIDAVLQIMRKKAHTDLAMLEKRELYGMVESDNSATLPNQETGNPDKNDPKYLRKFLPRILWERQHCSEARGDWSHFEESFETERWIYFAGTIYNSAGRDCWPVAQHQRAAARNQ